MKVEVNRGACCHVAGDMDFDKNNNLWMTTGDDTPATAVGTNNNPPQHDMLTNENQTITVANATGGTFTLTFDGQTTAPIAFPLVNTAIESALEALPNIDDVAVTGTAARTVNFRANQQQKDVPQMTADGSGLTGTAPTVTIATTLQGGLFQAPFNDARRSSPNTNDLRGKLLRIKVKDGDISAADQNTFGGSYNVPAGNLFAPGTAKTRPEIYAMGFRNPFRVQVDEDGVAYIADYSPDSQNPTGLRAAQGTGRIEIVRKPANYGWPMCYKTDLPMYSWDFNTQTTLGDDVRLRQPGPRADERLAVEHRPAAGPGAHEPGRLVLVPRRPVGHALHQQLQRRGPDPAELSAAVPGAADADVQQRRTAPAVQVRLRGGQPEHHEVPAVLRRRRVLRRVDARLPA